MKKQTRILPVLLGILVMSLAFTNESFAQTLGNEYSGWKSNTTFVVKIRCDENSQIIDEFYIKVGGTTVVLITDDDNAARAGLTYTNLEDFNGHNYDGFYNEGYGTYTFTKSVISTDEAYWTIEWTVKGLTDNSAVSLSFEHKWWNDDGSNVQYKTNTLSTFYSSGLPEIANVTIQANVGSTTLTWDPPAITPGSDPNMTLSTIIKKDGTEVGTVGITETTFTNNEEGGKYEVFHKLVYKSTTPSYSWELVGTAGGGTAPELPRVDKPVGVKASKQRCDGIIQLTWDYSGKYAPESFTINPGGISVAGDIREYEFVVGEHQTGTYTVTSVGTINVSDPSSAADGNTFGKPIIPAVFNSAIVSNTIVMDWTDVLYENKYLIKRTSPSGELQFELQADETTFTDEKVKGCETYTYQLYASNKCTADDGLIGVICPTTATQRIQPILNTYITSFDASKAYFPDKVQLEWSVEGDKIELVDRFEIFRSVAGVNVYKYLTSASKTASYEDKTAVGGVMYDYNIQAMLECENDVITSNKISEYGFRTPYGIVNGHIEYEDGSAVKNAEVIAEKSGGTVGTSLKFAGGTVNVPHNTSLEPTESVVVEAWIHPTSLGGIHNIVNKNNYKLYISGTSLRFEVAGHTTVFSSANAISLNQWTHVAGVFDGDTMKLFINGEIPYTSTYRLDATDYTDMETLKLPAQVIADLAPMQGIAYTGATGLNNFLAAIDALIGTTQKDVYSKLIIPIAKNDAIVPSCKALSPGTIPAFGNTMVIGSGFTGYIDEIRVWNIARTDDEIGQNYKSIINSETVGLGGYWRCDENMNGVVTKIFDASKTDTDYNKNDGTFSGSVQWSTTIPSADLLGWLGVTDANGDYTIPYIPYFGTGENFTITPRFGQHQFSPSSRTVFIGEASSIVNEQNFIDKSSFKVTGTIFYENTYCTVEGAIIEIDGTPVIKDGRVVMTDQSGEFTIQVPAGYHYVSVQKSLHEFESAKFPPGPTTALFNFVEPLTGINFIDITKVKVVGRVVGGTFEGNKSPNLGLSINNIGQASFRFESVTGPDCAHFDIITDPATGEYEVFVPPMRYRIRNFSIPKNLEAEMYFDEFEIADFSMIMPETEVSETTTGMSQAVFTINSITKSVVIEVDGSSTTVNDISIITLGAERSASFNYDGQSYLLALQDGTITTIRKQIESDKKLLETWYHFQHNFIYRSSPQITITNTDGSPFTGEQKIPYKDPLTGITYKYNLATEQFAYPVFMQHNSYQMLITGFEVYNNYDQCPDPVAADCDVVESDTVLVNDGEIKIYNELATERNAELSFENGQALYKFKAGEPNVMVDNNYPWKTFTQVLQVNANIDKYPVEWKPFSINDNFFRGYTIGAKIVKGSDFVTNGPEMVDYILRDPPGSGSNSYLAKGSSFTETHSISFMAGHDNSILMGVKSGLNSLVGGIGYLTTNKLEMSTEQTLELHVAAGGGEEWSQTTTTTETWTTSSEPDNAGAESDIFIGKSTNFVLGLTDEIRVFPETFATKHSDMIVSIGTAVGPAGERVTIGKRKGMIAAPESYPTQFIYTAYHIKTNVIPLIEAARNNLFISKPEVYQSKLDAGHPMYGTNNDDPSWGILVSSLSPNWTDLEDYDGQSYKYIKPVNEKDHRDQIRIYNQQIRLWKDALARNEEQKYNAKLERNISFSAGTEYNFEESEESSLTHNWSIELGVGTTIKTLIEGDINGVGTDTENSLVFNFTSGYSGSVSETNSTTWGFVLSDPDLGDYYSVDIKNDGVASTGPIFSVKAGRSKCPYHDEVVSEYYKPSKFYINEAALAKLMPPNTSQAPSDNLLKIFRWMGPQTITYSDGSIVKINAEKVFERVFETRDALDEAVIGVIAAMKEKTDSKKNKTTENYFSSEEHDRLFNEYMNLSLTFYSAVKKYETVKNGVFKLSEATIQRERPVLSSTQDELFDVPEDNKAYFELQLGNMSDFEPDPMEFRLRVLDETNPQGAVITMDGDALGNTFFIEPMSQINKILAIEIGLPDVYNYEGIQLALESTCENDVIADTITLSVHFVPSCTEVDIYKPKDQFVINYYDEKLVDGVRKTKVPVVMTGYDREWPTFDKLSFHYKPFTDPDWINDKTFYVTPPTPDDTQIYGDFTWREWDLSDFPDGKYQIRARTNCSADGKIFDLSEIWTGMVDRKPPLIFGTPSPADGILQPNDEISIKYNETIFKTKLSKLANFDMRGVLNGTKISHAAAVGFNNNSADYVRIPEGIILTDKSFTVEFWLKRDGTLREECVLSHGSDPNNALVIGFNPANDLFVQLGSKTFQTQKTPIPNPYSGTTNPYTTSTWHHWSVVYDQVQQQLKVYIDGVMVDIFSATDKLVSVGPVVIGKRIYEPQIPLKGSLHELRVWTVARTSSQLASNMGITLSGKETGLTGNWTLDECYGNLAFDKVRGLNAKVNTQWKADPAGYAAEFDGTDDVMQVKAPDLAFTQDQDFTLEFWFKGGAANDGKEVCLFSNGKGDGTDPTIYALTATDLFELARTTPLSTMTVALKAIENILYPDETSYMAACMALIDAEDYNRYPEQLIRYGKKPTTYWSVSTDIEGNILISNNGQSIKAVKPVEDLTVEKANYFDDKWHHFALAVERKGNTRVIVDEELIAFEPSEQWNGFGGAKFFVGALGWYDINSAGFVVEKHFAGQVDEFRVWNLVRRQEQIRREIANRLFGDEYGLECYYPFDEYGELMGIPILTAGTTDLVTQESTDTELLNGAILQNINVPTIKLQRPVSKVDYTFAASDDQIIFTIKDPPARVENCILDITVENVEDMYGNRMTSPITWSAYIDMNQMKWEQERFQFSKLLFAPLEFTATIRNSSGKQQTFAIGGLPAWLKASTMEGDMEPLSTKEITFTVDPGLNVGYYNVDLYLQTDFAFDEKLNIDIRVAKPMPAAWTVNPANFQHSMNIIALLKINNVISNDKYDFAGAFVDGECRGMVQMSYIEEYDMYEVFLTVYSNTETGENFEIHVWDASEGQEYSLVKCVGLPNAPIPYNKRFAFTSNEIYGYPSNPLIIETQGVLQQVIPLNKGWNWISFNLDFDRNIPLAMQLNGLDPIGSELIKSETQYTQYTLPIGWNGTLKALNYRDMFMFYVNQKDTLLIRGYSVDPELISLPIHENWNRISYLPLVNMPVKEAMARFHANHGAVLKNQYSFAMYDKYMGWLGSLSYMKPNEGYMLYYKPTGTLPLIQNLVYPEKGSLSKGLLMNNEELIMKNEEWGTVYRANALNMTILAEVQNLNIGADDVLGVFAENECVGYGTPVTMADGRKLFFIVANTDQNMSQLTFKLASGASSTLQTFSETTAFAANEMTGTLENPFILNANSEVTSGVSQQFNNATMQQCNVFPNPFTSKTNFEIYLENQEDIQIEIVDVTGRRVDVIQRNNVANGKHIVEWEGSRFANGVYTARITVGNELFTVKIVKSE